MSLFRLFDGPAPGAKKMTNEEAMRRMKLLARGVLPVSTEEIAQARRDLIEIEKELR
jgi:hypothetical protein